MVPILNKINLKNTRNMEITLHLLMKVNIFIQRIQIQIKINLLYSEKEN